MVVEGDQKRMAILLQNASISLGDGSMINFWKDVWCDEEVLSLAFPNLFRLTAQKKCYSDRVVGPQQWGRGLKPYLS